MRNGAVHRGGGGHVVHADRALHRGRVHAHGPGKFLELLRIELLELLGHLVGDAVQLGEHEVVLPQAHFPGAALLGQGEVVEEVLEFHHAAGLFLAVLVGGGAVLQEILLVEDAPAAGLRPVGPGEELLVVLLGPFLELAGLQQEVLLNWFGAVSAQSGRQFYENILLLYNR